MKVATVSTLLAALLLQPATASICKKGACNADNCARAATGSFDGKQTARLSACSSFQQCTVIPATTTVTATFTAPAATVTQLATVTTLTQVEVISSTVTLAPAKRDVQTYGGLAVDNIQARGLTSAPAVTVCPTAVPSSASACSGTVRYQSACSCAGVTKAYTTLAAPSTTVTVTAAAAPVTQIVPVVVSTTVTSFDIATITPVAAKPSTFNVRLDFPAGSDPRSLAFAGSYLALDNSFGEWSNRLQAQAINFMIDSDGNIVNAGSTNAGSDRVAVRVQLSSGSFIVWDTRQHYAASHVSYPFTKCQLVPSTLNPGSFKADCTTNNGNVPSICESRNWNAMGGAGQRTDAFVVFLGPPRDGCYPFEMTVVGT